MTEVLVYAEMKREAKAQRSILTWATASGKYKLDNQRGCNIPAKHLSVN